MKNFKWLYEHALQHKGEALESMLPECLPTVLIAELDDDVIF